MKFISRIFKFFGRVLKAAFRTTIKFVTDVVSNAPGIAILAGAAVGFTTLVTQIPFVIELPLWIEGAMIAPFIGIATVFVLITMMRIQLSLQHA